MHPFNQFDGALVILVPRATHLDLLRTLVSSPSDQNKTTGSGDENVRWSKSGCVLATALAHRLSISTY